MRYFEEWNRVLDNGLDAIVDVVTSPSQEARELRQNSPFAGVLPDETRLRVLQTFKDHWRREHERVLDTVNRQQLAHLAPFGMRSRARCGCACAGLAVDPRVV